MLGAFPPCVGHGIRFCKLVLTELRRQRRLFKHHLWLQLQASKTNGSSGELCRQFSRILDRTTELLWQLTLPRLPIVLKKPPSNRNHVHHLGGVTVPKAVHDVLAHSPSLQLSESDRLLSLVRQVSRLAPAADVERSFSEGVDALNRCKPASMRLPLGKTVTYPKGNGLCLLPADKEGGFAVLP